MMKTSVVTSIKVACVGLISVLIVTNCVRNKKSDSLEKITFEAVRSFRLGKDDRRSIRSRIGRPSNNYPAEDGRSLEYWMYSEGKGEDSRDRLSLGFDPDSGTLREVSWFVMEGEPEEKPARAKARFPGAAFKIRKDPWFNPHAAPSEDFFVDEKLHVTIVRDITQNAVTAIAWDDGIPDKPRPNAKAPVFKIGR